MTTPDFPSVFRAHADFVWRALMRFGVDDADADDMLQEVFLVVHRRMPELSQPRALRSWLFSICRRVASTHRRSQRRRSSFLASLPLPRNIDGTNPETQWQRRQAQAMVEAFLKTLGEEHRLVFVLYEIERFKGREIAEATGWKLNTVFTRLKSARRRFERYVREHEERTATDLSIAVGGPQRA